MHSMPQCLARIHRPICGSGWRPVCSALPNNHGAVKAAATQAGADLSSSVDKDSILADLRAAFSADAKPKSSTVSGTTSTLPGTSNQQSPAATAQQPRQGPVKKSKHRGRFANLLQSVERDLLNGAPSSSPSSSSSSISGGGATGATNSTTSSSRTREDNTLQASSSSNAQNAPEPASAEPSVPRQRRQRPPRPLPPGPFTFEKLVLVEEQQRLNPGQDAGWGWQATQQSGASRLSAEQQDGPSAQRRPLREQGDRSGPPRRQPEQRQQQQAQQPPEASSAQQRPLKRQKQFKPVLKGNLQLPGGPHHSALRRHVVAAGTNPALPTLDAIVIVEGDQDAAALARAVNAAAYVCDGTRAYKDHVLPELKALAALGRELLVLTDPDERGRDLRAYLDDTIGPLQHAFVSEADATATVDGPVHAIGNRGIEHARPAALQAALAAACRSFGAGRHEFAAEWAQAAGLANAFDADVEERDHNARERRRALCAVLGLGQCTSAAMLSALNRYFSREYVEQVLKDVRC